MADSAHIHSFDLFRVGSERERVYFDDTFFFEIGADILPLYERNIIPVRDCVTIHRGDINELKRWRQEIALLFIDIAKSWETNDSILQLFFPCLVPDAIVIQQDLVHFGHPWCAITMELLDEHFEYLGYVPFSSAVYRVVSPIRREELPINLPNLLSANEAVGLIHRCADRIDAPHDGYLRLAAASALVHYGSFAPAREIAAEIADRYTDEQLPWISEHVAMVREIIDRGEEGAAAT